MTVSREFLAWVRSPVFWAIPHLFLTACVAPVALVAQAQISDSGGVAIVQNSLPSWGTDDGWSVASEPDVVIGGWDATGPHAIFSVQRFTRLSDGAIAVLLWSRALFEVRIFEPDGSHRTTFGRSGDGPFEVGRYPPVSMTRLPGDSLRIVSQDNRVSVFGPNGEQGRSGRLDYTGRLSPSGWVTEDRFLSSRAATAGTEMDGWSEVQGTYQLESINGGRVADLATYRGRAWSKMNQGAFAEPYSGRRVHATAPGRVLIGESQRWEIREWDAEGRLRRVIRKPDSPREVTGDLRDAYVSWQQDRYSGVDPDLRRGLQAFQREIRFASHLPAFQDLELDAEGNLWALRYELPWAESALVWDVFDPEGRWLGPVEIPFEHMSRCRNEIAGCYDFEIGRDYILVRDHDEFDAVQLKVYQLRR